MTVIIPNTDFLVLKFRYAKEINMEGYSLYNEILKIANRLARGYNKSSGKTHSEFADQVIASNRLSHKDVTNEYHRYLINQYSNTIKTRIISRLEDNACKK